MSLSTLPQVLLDSLAGYPRWFVAVCLTIVAAVGLWVASKIIKWGLYLLIAAVVICGLVVSAWLLLQRGGE